VTVPFLHAQGLNRLKHLALTHGDVQHIGGAATFIEAAPTSRIVLSPLRFRSLNYRAVTKLLELFPERMEFMQRGDNNGHWHALHPEESDKFPQADDGCLVLLGEFHGTRILLLGDLGRPGQEALMKRATDLHADVVVTGLPEQGEALCDGLIERIQPKLIIVADSEFPATKRAKLALLDRLARNQVRVIATRTTGAVTVFITPSGWRAEPMREPPAG